MPGAGYDLTRLTARVRGHVQGVGYRYFARRTALSLGLRGYVRNLPDGTVEVVAEGLRPALDAYTHQLRHGPSGAWVDEVETEWAAAEGSFSGFHIRH
ncbi:MAG: acylphosphatase [Ktedonobacterales bacterium]